MRAEQWRSVAEQTRERLSELTASERKVGRTLLAAYPVAGLETVAQLAERANVSPPTVVRFVSKLGFAGYPAFQQSLMREVNDRMGSPLEQYAAKEEAQAGKKLLPYAASTFGEMLSNTFMELPKTEFDQAVDALCNRRGRVYLIGGRFSDALASYLAMHLKLLRPNVEVVGRDDYERLAVTEDADKSSTLVVFDYRRYDADIVEFALLMSGRGAHVILLTDRWFSPIADFAATVLPARVESPSPFDSLVPAMAIVEAVVAAVVTQMGRKARSRLERIEATLEEGGTGHSSH